jgi:hypothetical protein
MCDGGRELAVDEQKLAELEELASRESCWKPWRFRCKGQGQKNEKEMFRVQKSPCGSDRPCGEASGGAGPGQRTCRWLCKQNGLRRSRSSKSRYGLEVSGVIIRLARYKYSRSSNAVPALAASPRPVNSFIRGMNNIPVLKRAGRFSGIFGQSSNFGAASSASSFRPILAFAVFSFL